MQDQRDFEKNLARTGEYITAAAAAITRLDMSAVTLRRVLADEAFNEEGEKLELTHLRSTVEVVLESIDLCLGQHGWVCKQYETTASLASAVEEDSG